MIEVHVTEDVTGNWWCYLIQRNEEAPDKRIFGRRFASSYEAAKWGLEKAERYRNYEHENLSR